MPSKLLAVTLVGTGIVATAGINAGSWNPASWFNRQPVVPSNTALATSEAGVSSATPEEPQKPIAPAPAPNYKAIVERFGPSVVGVTTEGVADATAGALPERLANDPFYKFFQGIPGFQGSAPLPGMPSRGQGSGFIVGADGLILTNAHVVRDAREATVKLSDRREYRAKVLGNDPASDVAVLKIDATGLPVVNVGNPARLRVGDYVLAIGAPFGFEHSATAGIVSAKGRSLPGETYVPFIQTDVAVNPGNSGGPLFNAYGNVIGINAQIYSRSGGYRGVSFAIPIDVALKVKEQIVTTGKVRHARLGVTVQEVNQALANSFKLQQPKGALVSRVTPGSAAQKAGLQAGDVILKYNGTEIVRSADLTARVGSAQPGDKVNLTVWRAGKPKELMATLLDAENSMAAPGHTIGEGENGLLGIAVRPLSHEESKRNGIDGGIVVEQSGGPASRAGIRPGDIIVSLNGKAVKSADELASLLANDQKTVALLIQRGETRIFVPVPMS
ncbi:Do family serine endopeptidase [Noviherbaspirillum sp.]|uniref:Do family serine endopeptidase n=1 Tax=Noviherbaspirillum sp. TaxID=1926288 RepID=UPI002FDF7F55